MTLLTPLSQGDDTPLLEAAWYGKTTTVQLLVAKGAIVNKANSVRRNPYPSTHTSLWNVYIYLFIFSTEKLAKSCALPILSVIGFRFDFKIAFILFEKIKDISRQIKA